MTTHEALRHLSSDDLATLIELEREVPGSLAYAFEQCEDGDER